MGRLSDYGFGYGSLARDLLADLDRRERNYDRIDVTDAIDNPPAEGRVWAYVEDGFRRLGPAEHADFVATSDFEGLPRLDLERVDIPAERNAR